MDIKEIAEASIQHLENWNLRVRWLNITFPLLTSDKFNCNSKLPVRICF